MARFESQGIDDFMNDLANLEVEVECPDCGKPFDIPAASSGTTVTCPHCGCEIAIESAE